MADNYVTLAEAANLHYTEGVFDADIIMNTINSSPILSGGVNVPGGAMPAALPFRIINDRIHYWVRESVEPAGDWYDPGEPVSGNQATVEQDSVTIRSLKRRIAIPREVQRGYSSLIDQVSSQLRQQLKGMVSDFMDAFYYGDNATNSKDPNGIHLLRSYATPDMEETCAASTATPAALTLSLMDKLVFLDMKEGADMIVMPRVVYALFAAAKRNSTTGIGANLQYGVTEFGQPVLQYAGIPMYADDYLGIVELCNTNSGAANLQYSAKTGGSAASLHAIKFGPNHLHAISFSQAGPQVTLLSGPTQDYDGDILWLTWDVAFARKSNYSIGSIVNIDDATAITA